MFAPLSVQVQRVLIQAMAGTWDALGPVELEAYREHYADPTAPVGLLEDSMPAADLWLYINWVLEKDVVEQIKAGTVPPTEITANAFGAFVQWASDVVTLGALAWMGLCVWAAGGG